MRLQIELIDSQEKLDALQVEWNALLRRSGSCTIFLTWEWITTWWAVYGGEAQLHVLAARDATGRLVGIGPFQRSRRSAFGVWRQDCVRFIGQGGDVTPEYLDVIAEAGLEVPVAEALTEHLDNHGAVDVIDLRPVAAQSPGRRALQSILERRRGHVRCTHDSLCPVLHLPQSVGEFLAAQSRNYRKKIGEYERRCARDLAVRLRRTGSLEELNQDMAALVTLHHNRWQGRSGAFKSARYIAFHWRLAALLLDRGWLRLYSLESGARRLAVSYCFAYEGTYYFYQSGRDLAFPKHRVGMVLMHRVIQEAIREGATTFDFLRGDEAYKYHWAKTNVPSVRLVYWKNVPAWVNGNLRETIRNITMSATRATTRLVVR